MNKSGLRGPHGPKNLKTHPYLIMFHLLWNILDKENVLLFK